MTRPPPSVDLPGILAEIDRLPSLPAAMVEVLRLSRDERSTIEDLARAIGRDPALSAKLLKLANSSLFGQGQEVRTLPRAVVVLGLKTVKLMSLSFSLLGSLPRGREAAFDYDVFWERSLIAAVAGRTFAKRCRGQEDEAFLCGLLKHMGKLIMARCLPEAYAPVLARSRGWPEAGVEQELLGFDSAQVAAALLRTWDLPPVIHRSIEHQSPEDLSDVGRDVRYQTDVLCVTSLVEDLLLGTEKGAALEALEREAEGRLGLAPPTVEALLLGLEPELREAAELLSVPLQEGRTHEALLEEARQQIVQVSLGTALELDRVERRTRELELENQELESRALTDGLTGLPNRAAFDRCWLKHVRLRLGSEIPRALGLLMIDVDRFKGFNDTYGHASGDEVLRMVGSVLRSATRKGDLRYGGEEFAVIAPSVTAFGLKSLAERLRRAVAEAVLEVDLKKLSVTVSLGGACVTRLASEADGTELVKLADRLLYQAKAGGRNRCELYTGRELPAR